MFASISFKVVSINILSELEFIIAVAASAVTSL
jgi:hypothetical protein